MGSVTTSHLRFGPRPIESTYLIQRANFVAVHQFNLLEKFPVLDTALPDATVLLNSPFGPDETWGNLPHTIREQILRKNLKLYVLDALSVAKSVGMGGRINTVMQTAFFALSGVLPRDEAIAQIKKAIAKTYGKRGEVVVQKNYEAVDAALAHLHEVPVPKTAAADASTTVDSAAAALANAPEFVRNVTAEMIAGRGDYIPVSALPADGTYPVGTTKYEKRNIADEIPVWETDLCIQCGKCVLVCPHSVIRPKVVAASELANAPDGFKSMPAKWRELRRAALHASGVGGGLHRLRPLRGDMPGEGQEQRQPQGAQHGPAASAPRGRDQELGLLPDAARSAARRWGSVQHHQECAAPPAAVRILRGMLRLRRNALRQAGQPAFRRARGHRERDGAFLHLRRQPADHAVDQEQARQGPGMVQLSLRVLARPQQVATERQQPRVVARHEDLERVAVALADVGDQPLVRLQPEQRAAPVQPNEPEYLSGRDFHRFAVRGSSSGRCDTVAAR